jgi:CheY-like chemotaxis protein
MTRILVVDDEAAIRDLVTTMLQDEGYEVVSARNGAEALERLAAAPPDLLLTDWMMPILDGKGLLDHLRNQRHLDGLAVVVMSAAVRPDIEAGTVAAFLPKPFDLTLLLDIVSRLTGHSPT